MAGPGRGGAAHTAAVPTTRRRVAVNAPRQAAPPARASRMSVGVAAHVFSGNCGVVRRSKPLNPRADCVLGHGVATALRHGFLPRLRLCPLAPTALRLSEQVQGNLDAVRAVCGETARGSAARLFFALFFLLLAIPRRPNASDAVEYAISHLETTPKTPPPRRHDAANEVRARVGDERVGGVGFDTPQVIRPASHQNRAPPGLGD